MANPVGKMYVELDLDSTKYTKAQKAILKGAEKNSSDVNKVFKTVGTQTDKMYDAMRQNVQNALYAIKKSHLSSTAEIVRAEQGAAQKIKQINEQQYGSHLSWIDKMKSSFASMAAASILSIYGIKRAFQSIVSLIMDGVHAIDDLKISSISVASQIASMQGPENITINYKNAVKYATSLNEVLMKIDATSFANFEQIQLMNRAMINQGVLLDINNEKQMESFTALTNAIALFTTGQDKAKQATQEMRGLMSGLARPGNMVALQMDELIKRQGKYKDGLKELIQLGNEHGDTLERMLPYLAGIVEANEDIQSTWEAVSSSLETSWNIIQRGLFKDMYDDLNKVGRQFSEWLKDNSDRLVASLKVAKESMKIFLTHDYIGLIREFIKQVEGLQKKDGGNIIRRPIIMPVTPDLSEETKKATEDITEAIRKMSFEQESIGRSQYDKDVKRIDAEVDKYRKAGVDELTIKKYYSHAITIAKGDEQERQLKIAKRASERFKSMMLREYEYSADRHGDAINKILADEERKYEMIKRLQEEGGATPDQAAEAKSLIQANTAQLIAEENERLLNEKADFYSQLSDYETEYRDMVFELIDKEAKRKKEAFKDEVVAAKWARDQKLKFDQEVSKQKLENTAKGFGAVADTFEQLGNLYDKDSKEREKLHKISMVFHVAEQAALAADAIKTAALAIATQGTGGDPFSAFARIAAMMATMAGVLSAAGISFSGSNVSSSSASLPASTVLGAEAGTGSESGSKSWDLLENIYDMEYRELTNIYKELRALNNNISGLVSNIYRTGSGLSSLGFKPMTDETSKLVESTKKLSDMIPSILKIYPSFLAGSLVDDLTSAILGGKTKTRVTQKGFILNENTISDILEGLSDIGSTYVKIKTQTSGGLLGSDKTKYKIITGQMDQSTAMLFSQIYTNLSNILIEASESFGTDINEALNYTFEEINLNLKGKTSDEIAELINNEISKIGDLAAESLFGNIIGIYQKVGEGLLETATRLIVDKAIVLELLDKTNQSLDMHDRIIEKSRQAITEEWLAWDALSKRQQHKVVEPEKYFTEYYEVAQTATDQTIELTESLIELAGSLEDLESAVSSYYDKFFSDEEKMVRLHENLSAALSDINERLPDSRSGYRDIVESLDLTTESGREAYVTLMMLADAADQYYTDLEGSLDDATDSQDAYIESLKELSVTIDEWLANLNLGSLSPVGSEAAWKAEYTKLHSAAIAEGAEASTVTDFLNYATKFLSFEKTYGTDQSYQQIYDAVVADVLAIQALNTSKISGYASGGLTSGLSVAGEIGREWVVPTYEPHKSKFLKDVGADPESIGKAIANNIRFDGQNTGDIKVSVIIDGREIGNAVAKQTRTNADLKKSIKRAVS